MCGLFYFSFALRSGSRKEEILIQHFEDQLLFLNLENLKKENFTSRLVNMFQKTIFCNVCDFHIFWINKITLNNLVEIG